MATVPYVRLKTDPTTVGTRTGRVHSFFYEVHWGDGSFGWHLAETLEQFSGPPVGQPGIRDIGNRCAQFEPGSGELAECDTDGHYMCQECTHAKLCRTCREPLTVCACDPAVKYDITISNSDFSRLMKQTRGEESVQVSDESERIIFQNNTEGLRQQISGQLLLSLSSLLNVWVTWLEAVYRVEWEQFSYSSRSSRGAVQFKVIDTDVHGGVIVYDSSNPKVQFTLTKANRLWRGSSLEELARSLREVLNDGP